MYTETPLEASHSRKRILIGIGILIVLMVVIWYVFIPPARFPSQATFVVNQGQSLSSISQSMQQQHLIRSRALFEFFVIAAGKERGVVAGPYQFDHPQSIFTVAHRIANGRYGIEPVRVTIPEGYTISEMSTVFTALLPAFSEEEFQTLTAGREGYLFPDTYFFFPDATAEDVYQKLSTTFTENIEPYLDDIDASGRTLEEVVIMASIVEREADGKEDAPMIAGILWKRIDRGFPLQVDAPFLYSIGKGSSELSQADLERDGPYNTYTRTGLPPTAIGSPGIVAIEATVYPQESPYLFYLHAPDRSIYYAETFDEHRENKRKYLR